MSLTAASHSEWTKLFSTAAWWILGLVLVLYVGFVAGAMGGALAAGLGEGPQTSSTDGIAAVVYSTATSVGYVIPLLLGTLMVTSEFRHGTLTPTFLATPKRSRVLVAKLLIAGAVGALFGVVGAIASVGVGAPLLAIGGVDTAMDSADTWAMVWRMVLAFALWALIGIGVGATVRNQVAAIVIVLAFTQFVEPVARAIAPFVDGLGEVTRFLPGAASDALVGSTVLDLMGAGSVADDLAWWAGALVMLGYALVFVVIGSLTTWRRDVD